MVIRRITRAAAVMALLVGLLSSSGCAYMSNRGRDAMDVIDAGVTTSKEPQFALYAGFLNIASLGYSGVDGNFYGIPMRQAGSFQTRQNAGGLLVWGYEELGYAEMDQKNPQYPPHWKVGPVGLVQGPRPPAEQVLNCPKLLHLGWIGLTVNCNTAELGDFLVGWTTIDYMDDDS